MQDILSVRNSKCKLCELHKSAENVCIIGKGSVPAKLMLLGESPGEEENKQGEVFIGRAGKMLKSVTDTLGIKDYYVTNAIKCHPLMNSKPTVGQLDTCTTAYLRKEIQLVKPDLIIALGGIAARVLLAETNIGPLGTRRNTVWYTQGPLPTGIPFIVTYHPAATLYPGGESLLNFIVEDMEWAKRLLAGELPNQSLEKKVNYQMLDSIWSIPGIREAKWIDIDLETAGLDPFLPSRNILSCQISIKEGEAYYFEWTERLAKGFSRLIIRHGGSINTASDIAIGIGGHNIKYDLKWLRVKGDIRFTGKINDTVQNLHLLDENFPSKELDTMATAFTGIKAHKDQFKKLVRNYVKLRKEKKEGIQAATARLYEEAYNSIPIKTRISYGCADADATGRLRREFKPRLREAGLLPLHNLMMNVTHTILDMECNGMCIDLPLVVDLKQKYKKRLKRLVKDMNELVPVEVSPSAPLQIRSLLYSTWKLYPHEIRQGKKKIKYSTAKAALELLLKDELRSDQRTYITNLLEYRKLSKLHGTYLEGLDKHLREGFIHATWRLDGADSGRSSCSEPNLQNIPRKGTSGDIKQMFISRFKDGVIVGFDVSQGELRLAAQYSGEPNLCRLFNTGTNDIHRTITADLLGISEAQVTEEQRHMGKTVDFLVMYGGGARTMVQSMRSSNVGMHISEKQAFSFIRMWHKRFSLWKAWVEETERQALIDGYVKSLYGRYRRLMILDPHSEEGKKALRVLINALLQGGLSDFVMDGGYRLWKRVQSWKHPEDCLVIGQVHDQWLYDVRKYLVPSLVEAAVDVFENPDTSAFGFKYNIPMKIDVSVGPNWKELVPYEN